MTAIASASASLCCNFMACNVTDLELQFCTEKCREIQFNCNYIHTSRGRATREQELQKGKQNQYHMT